MKDYRMTLALAVPLSLAVIGLLWILKKKTGSGGKKKPTTKMPVELSESGVSKDSGRRQIIDNDGITVTQRKIPDTLARDRGSADKCPDVIAGSVHSSVLVSTCQPGEESVLVMEKCKEELAKECVAFYQGSCETGKSNVQNNNISCEERPCHTELLLSADLIDPKITPEETVNLLTNSGEEVDVKQTLTPLLAFRTPDIVQPTNDFNIDPKVTLESMANLLTNVGSEVEQTELAPMTNSNDLHTKDNELVESSTCVERAKAEQLVMSALEDALTEAQSQLAMQSIEDTVLKSCSGEKCIVEEEQASGNDSTDGLCSYLVLCPTSEMSVENCNLVDPEHCCDIVEPVQSESNCNMSPLQGEDPTLSPLSLDTNMNAGQVCAVLDLPAGDDNGHTMDLCKPVQGSMPCDAMPLATPPSTSISFDSLMSSCTDYALNWSVETATDDVCYADSGMDISSIPPMTDKNSTISADGGDSSDLLHPSSLDPQQNSPMKSNSPLCDNDSEGSNDSGRGGSEHDTAGQIGEALVHYHFNMPTDLCGRFIGKHGKNINYLKSKTGTDVSLINNPYTGDYQICEIIGTHAEVEDALAMIRRKFPPYEYPHLTMVAINYNPVPSLLDQPMMLPEGMQLTLPEGVSVEVFVSSIVDAGHIFVQQPTHRSFMSLEKLSHYLNTVYMQDQNVPCVPTPVKYGVICACESGGSWYRVMIMCPENENGETQVKFVDYGGYATVSVTSLKQIRTDMMSLPFQAVECFMANITPNEGEQYFSEEATNALNTMTTYKLLQLQVVARTETGVPYVHLYHVSPESNSALLINQALVNSSLVRWIEIL